jgi:hypothetical protein
MDARGQLLEIADRTRRQLAETDGPKTVAMLFESESDAGPWPLKYWHGSPAVAGIANSAVLELGEIAIEAFDHLPPHIRGAVRPYRHDPAATWSRVIGSLVATQGKVFGRPDPFVGPRCLAFTRAEAVTACAAEALAEQLQGKPKRGGGKRGRKPKPEDEDRIAIAVFWYEQSLDDDGEKMKSAILQGDSKPAAVYEAAKQYELEIRRAAIPGGAPKFWPTKDGDPAPTWSFKDYASDVGKDAFVRYMAMHKERTSGPAAAAPIRTEDSGKIDPSKRPTAAPRLQKSLQPSKRPTAAILLQKALQQASEALLPVAQDMTDPKRWVALEKALVKAGVDGDYAKELLAGRDRDALERAGLHVKKLFA